MASFGSTRERFGAIEVAPRGYIDAGNNKVQNVKYPTNPKDGVNKEYVDRFYDVGDLKLSIRTTDFHGWLKCDGRSLSRTTYASLFAVIGTAFGSINGNSFNLPDCRGRVIGTLGQGSGLTNRTLGTSVGAETHTLTTGEIPSHTHTSNASGGTLGLVTSDGSNTASSGLDFTTGEPNLYTSPSALTINNAGGGGAHNNMQPTIFMSNVFVYSGLEN
jgi:microcystin-dependent protein